jgi:transcriptional regulator with XRE-family HTH domain
MKILRETRQRLGWTLTELANKLDIPHQRLSEYETGKALPSPTVADQIAELLGLSLPSHKEQVSPTDLSRRYLLRRYQLESYSPLHWERALEHIEPPDFQRWVTHFIRCDSSLEAQAWLQLLCDGARATLVSPLYFDFRANHLIDTKGQPLGLQPLPCLHHPKLEILLWPQVNLKTNNYHFRCDALSFDGQWAMLEIDGAGHQTSRDDFRRRQLGLSEWRFSESEIRSHGLPDLLKDRQTKRRTGGP